MSETDQLPSDAPVWFKSVLGIIRTALSFGGGYAVAEGWFTHAQADQVSGAIVALTVVGLTVYDKVHAAKTKQAAVAVASGRVG